MNFIAKGLPVSINAGSHNISINTDFRVWMQLESLQSSCTDEEYAARMLELILAQELPKDIDSESLANGIIGFYLCGKPSRASNGESGGDKQKRIYDYDCDAGYIYAAFMQQYGISLTEIAYLHWWEYRAMLDSLTESCKFVEILSYRAAETTPDMSNRQKEHIRRMQKIYALPLPQDEQDKEDAINAILLGDGDLRGLI